MPQHEVTFINPATHQSETIIYRRLKAGDVQSWCFKEDDLPPFTQPDAPKRDITIERVNQSTGAIEQHTIQGYVGKPKGKYHYLMERGLYLPTMHAGNSGPEISRIVCDKGVYNYSLDCNFVLSQCSDFLAEKGALATLIESRGHICVASPKCHPELAGNGIEYAWGIIKKKFRAINDEENKNLVKNIEESYNVLSIDISWRFQRKARTYRRTYCALNSVHETSTFEIIEKMTQKFKSHRNIEEIESKYISRVLAEVESDITPEL
jgi:hypothetical protein